MVIPLHNCLALTRECLRTLQASLPSGLSHEIILVDDDSSDGTREWLKGLSLSNGLKTLSGSCRVVLNERNLGFAGACNRGAAAAQGEFLFFLNNDLVLPPGWLEPMLDGFARLPRAGVVGNVQLNHSTREIDHAGIFIGADGKPAHAKTVPEAPAATPDHAPMTAVTAACVVIPRGFFTELGGFDENFRNGGEDVDFCFRARAAGRTTWVALKSTVLHHVSATPGRKSRDEENSYRLFRKWRPEIEREAWRAWCEAFLADARAGGIPRHPKAERCAGAFLAGRRPRPGPWAETNVAQNLLTEEARWERLFPDFGVRQSPDSNAASR